MKKIIGSLILFSAWAAFGEGQEVGSLPEIVVQEEETSSTSELDKSSVVPTIKLPKKETGTEKSSQFIRSDSGGERGG
ncbi:MAG: hypothetical protein EBQ92_04475 [Proteobacteria bacterium]|nr:hypothetical protein [Pseudomonadota bacterium]